MTDIKIADWVTCSGCKGIVKRLAKDGTWADVDWGTHRKRMPVTALTVVTTLPIGDGWTVTDMARASELGHQYPEEG